LTALVQPGLLIGLAQLMRCGDRVPVDCGALLSRLPPSSRKGCAGVDSTRKRSERSWNRARMLIGLLALVVAASTDARPPTGGRSRGRGESQPGM